MRAGASLRWWVALATAWLSLAGGCALWTPTESTEPALPPSRLSSDSVVLEVAFVKIPVASEQDSAAGDWWDYVDEQPLAIETRAALAQNGIRGGVLGEHLPEDLRSLLPSEPSVFDAAIEAAGKDQSEASDDSIDNALADGASEGDEAALAAGSALEDAIAEGSAGQRLPCRPGRRSELLIGRPFKECVLLWTEAGQLSGDTLQQAQCLLAVTAWPRPDGRVKLSLVPEIKHGAVRNRYVGQEGRFLIEAGQDQKIFNSLRIDCELAPGETLALASTPDIKSVGSRFFADADSGERRVVLVRLALTQDDGLFSKDKAATPLVTPLE